MLYKSFAFELPWSPANTRSTHRAPDMVYQPAQTWGQVPIVNKTPYDVNGREDIALYFVTLSTNLDSDRGTSPEFGHTLFWGSKAQAPVGHAPPTGVTNRQSPEPPAHLAYIAKNANLSPAPVALKHQNTNAKSLWLDRTKRQTPHMYARWLTIGLVKVKVLQVYQ